MAFLLPFVGFNFFFRLVACYNLETSHPVILEAPTDVKENSYFGMSVAIRPKAASLNNTWTIQVGAPRGHPGIVYRCRTFGPCVQFDLDKKLRPFGGLGVTEFKEKKEAAWLGVAMDIKSCGSKESSVVCGHRWMNQNLKNPENIDITYLMTGVCYLQDLFDVTSETPVQRLLPLVNQDKIYSPKPYVVHLSTYHWGLGQAGFSVMLTEQCSNLLVGAPGVTHWIGSIIRYEKNFGVTVGNFARALNFRKNRYTYLGYSVGFGRFYKGKEIWCVTGAPRSANYRGQVFTFRFKDTSDDVSIQSSITGATFGEYFGSSLTTGDLNGDGYDDLVVGAPLFSDKDPDEGRIYVYMGTGQGNFLEPAQVINGRIGQGRFGSSITAIKDLDQDGYGDVAVGAPYEDNRRGAIYIYRGFSKGLQIDFSQRIRAQNVHPHLRGFGMSISPAVDADGNKYLDIAVGAYLSGHVILLRSRSVVSLHPSIKTENVTFLDRKTSYFNVTFCSRYAGSNAPPYLDITRIIEIDPMYGRGTLDSKTSSARKLIRLKSNQIICEIHPIILNMSQENFSPLQIFLRNEIRPCESNKGNSLLIKGPESKGADSFPKACPIGNKAYISKELTFAGICGTDFLCRSDLELFCDVPDFRGGSYILTSEEFIVLSVKIKNHGEPASQTKIKIWSNLKLNRRNEKYETSSDSSSHIYWLDIGGLLVESYQTNFSFQIDFEALKKVQGENLLNLLLEISTSNFEKNTGNNNCKFSVKLESDAFFEFHSSSSTASYHMTNVMLQNQILTATHYYEVLKTGVTPVKDAELTIYIPFYFNAEFLTFEMEAPEWMHFSEFYEVSDEADKGKPGKSRLTVILIDSTSRTMLSPQSESGVKNSKNAQENCPPTNRTLFLNCSTEKSNCKIQKFFFSKGIPQGFSSYVKILISLNITAIGNASIFILNAMHNRNLPYDAFYLDLINSLKNEKDIIYLSTTGVFKYTKFFDKEPEQLQRSASISLYSEDRELHLDLHVIALSILAGGFLFSLIVTGMAKNNFFRRSKKQALKAIRDADVCFIYFATGANSQAPLSPASDLI